MSLDTFLLMSLIFFIVVAWPAWPYSKPWGYTPTGVLSLFLIIFIVWAIAVDRPLFRSNGKSLNQAGRDASDSIRRTLQ